MTRATTAFLCIIPVVLAVEAGEPHAAEKSLTAAPKPPVSESAAVFAKPVRNLSESEIRAEITERKQQLKEEERALKLMISSGGYSGATELFRRAASNRRRIMRLQRQISEAGSQPQAVTQ